MRSAVFRTVIAEGGEREYVAIKDEYANTASIDGKEICLLSMGRVHDPSLISDFMDFQFSDKVAIQDMHTGSVSLATNAKARNAFWAYIKNNWEKVHRKLSGNALILDRYIKFTLSRFASHEVEKDIAGFFEGKATTGYDRGLVQVADSVKANASYKERDEPLLLEWLQAHGYA